MMPRSIAPTRAARHLALAALLVLAAGCRSSTGDEPLAESAACPQTFEFGNHGCARLVVVFEQPAAPLPSAYIYDVRAVSARGRDQGAPEGLAPNPAPGAVPLQLTLWQRLPEAAGDTVSMWITARLFDASGPAVTGAPLPVFAADSALRVVRFAPVGSVPATDTVHLTLRRP